MNEMLLELGQNAKEAENMLRTITTNKKNQVLAAVAEHLVECTDELIKANAVDVENGKKNNMPERTGRTDFFLHRKEFREWQKVCSSW